jgi:hypothetical protein
MSLTMTAGDTRPFLGTFTKAGAAFDLTGAQSLTCTARTPGGTIVWQHSLADTYVSTSPAVGGSVHGGLAVCTVQPVDTTTAFVAAGIKAPVQLAIRWVLTDSQGNVTTTENTTMSVTP